MARRHLAARDLDLVGERHARRVARQVGAPDLERAVDPVRDHRGVVLAPKSLKVVTIGTNRAVPAGMPEIRFAGCFVEWAIQDSNLGPLPYQPPPGV
jgi:hypothetical protein